MPTELVGDTYQPNSFIVEVDSSSIMYALNQTIIDKSGVATAVRNKYNVEYSRAAGPESVPIVYGIDDEINKVGICDNDVLHVYLTTQELKEPIVKAHVVKNYKKKKTNPADRRTPADDGQSIATGGAMRAAAKEAIRSFPEKIKQQELYDRSLKKEERERRKKTAQSKNKDRTSSKKTILTKNMGLGRRLGDSDDVVLEDGGDNPVIEDGREKNEDGDGLLATLENKRLHPRKASGIDHVENLVSCFGKGNNNSMAKVIRAAFKDDLNKRSYLTDAAMAVNAVQGNNFSFHPVDSEEFYERVGHRLGSGEEPSQHESFRIARYHKGVDATAKNKYNQVEFELYSVVELQELFSSLYSVKDDILSDEWKLRSWGSNEFNTGADLLDPTVIACSFVDHFWSLVYHQNRDAQRELSIEDLLAEILPDLDWTLVSKSGRKDKARGRKRKATILLK